MCALVLLPPLRPDHLYLFSTASSSSRSVTLFSPFTAGLGYSFRRQAHSVSLLLRVTERQTGREGAGERERERGTDGWGEKNGKEGEKKDKPQLCRRKEKIGRQIKETRERRGARRKKILEEHQSQREVQRSWHTYDSLFYSPRPSPSLNIFSFSLFFFPLPPLPSLPLCFIICDLALTVLLKCQPPFPVSLPPAFNQKKKKKKKEKEKKNSLLGGLHVGF